VASQYRLADELEERCDELEPVLAQNRVREEEAM
jgi:hypothetical protein